MKRLLYPLFNFKRYIEQVIMFPFVLTGKIYARMHPLNKEYDIILFFTSYQIGGAERVNAEILNAIEGKKALIFFTKKSPNEGMKEELQRPSVDFKEISHWTDNKKIYFMSFVYRGICAEYINKQSNTQVFNGQTNFGYKLLPHLKRSIKVTELIHMHDQNFLWVWAPFVQFINQRVLIGEFFTRQFKNIYEEYGIPLKYTERFIPIRNCLDQMPTERTVKSFDKPLKVYYAGRGGAQKRIWILLKIIEKSRALKLPLEFKLAGSFGDEMPQALKDDGTYVGEINGGDLMNQFHKQNDILLMTSAWEGFPMVIMEAIANGSITISPAIDGIPDNIVHQENGFLISEVIDEEAMVSEIICLFQAILNSRYNLNTMQQASFEMLQTNFSKELFAEKYRSVFGFS